MAAEEEADIVADLPTYFILGQEADAMIKTEEPRMDMATVPTTKKITETHKNDVYSRNIAQRIHAEARSTINDEGMVCRKVSIDGGWQVTVPETFRQANLCNSY